MFGSGLEIVNIITILIPLRSYHKPALSLRTMGRGKLNLYLLKFYHPLEFDQSISIVCSSSRQGSWSQAAMS